MIIKDEEIEELPEDPELAFVNKVLAAARAFKIDALKDWQLSSVDGNCWQAYRRFVHAVDFATTQIRITHAGRSRNNSVGLDGNTKAKIHSYVQKIRIVLDKAELPELKRDLHFRKFDAFVVEVNKARTSLQSVASVYLSVCMVIGEGFNKLEPVRRFINSIATLMAMRRTSRTVCARCLFQQSRLTPHQNNCPHLMTRIWRSNLTLQT